MTKGLWHSLTPAQRAKVLAYDGPEEIMPVYPVYYFDGGAKPNPGEMEVGLVEVVGTKKQPYRQQIGPGTNNLAEWTALIWALEMASAAGHRRIEVVGDSQLVVNQCLGLWKVSSADLRPYKALYDSLVGRFDAITVRHVPRGKNLAGLMLEGQPF